MNSVYLYHRASGPLSLDETFKPTFPIQYALREWGGKPPADAATQRAPHPHTMAAIEGWIDDNTFQLVTGILGEPLPAIPHRDENGKRIPVYLGHHLNVYKFSADGALILGSRHKATKKGYACELLNVDVDTNASLFETASFVAETKKTEGPFFGFWPVEGPMAHFLVRTKKVDALGVKEAGQAAFNELGFGARSGALFRKLGEVSPTVNGTIAQLMLLDPEFLNRPADPKLEASYWQLLHRAYLGAWHSEAVKQRRAAV